MKKLSDAELDIMMRIWEAKKPLSLDEIDTLMAKRNWSTHTIRNFISRIVAKGYLKVEKDGRRNLYSPIVSEEYIDQKGKSLIARLYDDSVQHFVARLYEADSVSKEDLKALRDYLDHILEDK